MLECFEWMTNKWKTNEWRNGLTSECNDIILSTECLHCLRHLARKWEINGKKLKHKWWERKNLGVCEVFQPVVYVGIWKWLEEKVSVKSIVKRRRADGWWKWCWWDWWSNMHKVVLMWKIRMWLRLVEWFTKLSMSAVQLGICETQKGGLRDIEWSC